MPIKLALDSPAARQLLAEGVDVIEHGVAVQQDIRPLRIALLNLMPNKINTEVQIARLLGSTPLQIELTLLRPSGHASKNTNAGYLEEFYITLDSVGERKFDGLIVTGAPVEHLAFEEINYWKELSRIINHGEEIAFSRLYICWGAQAALFQKYGVERMLSSEKLFGIYKMDVLQSTPLLRGFPDKFDAPVSRYATIPTKSCQEAGLHVVAASAETGASIIVSPQNEIFILDHLEYDTETLREEYRRDMLSGASYAMPSNYFQQDKADGEIENSWRPYGHIVFNNWIYLTYENVPFDFCGRDRAL